jgi:hypothetical protein
MLFFKNYASRVTKPICYLFRMAISHVGLLVQNYHLFRQCPSARYSIHSLCSKILVDVALDFYAYI